MKEDTSLIGIMGGTFDPVHNGHLRTAVEFRDWLNLDTLYLVPCRCPPHRGEPAASAADRLAMLRLAAEGLDRIVVDQRELSRGGPSYTVDTLRSFREQCGERMGVCLLLGSDAFNQLDTWREWTRLFSLSHLVVADRPGHAGEPNPAVAAALEQRLTDSEQLLATRASGSILRHRFTLLEISASQIRALRRARRTIKYLVPDVVIDYVNQAGLYLT